MHGHAPREGRDIQITGTKGTIKGELSSFTQLTIIESDTGFHEDIDIQKLHQSGHGGGWPFRKVL